MSFYCGLISRSRHSRDEKKNYFAQQEKKKFYCKLFVILRSAEWNIFHLSFSFIYRVFFCLLGPMVKYSHSQTKEKSKEVTFIYSSIKGTGKNRLVGAIRRFSFICWSLLSPNRNLRDEIRIVSPLSHLLVLPSVLFYFCIFPKERTFHFKSIISLDWTPRQLAAVRSKKMLYYVTNAIAVSSFQSEREWYVFFLQQEKETNKEMK